MQYKVPQQIDQEDKILGPLTFIQFIYVLIGGGLILLTFTLFDLALALLVAIPIGLFTIAFALIKIQDQPFSRFFVAFLIFLRQPKRRLWQSAESGTDPKGVPFGENLPASPAGGESRDDKSSSPPAHQLSPLPTKPARKVPIQVR